jgi:hypothetical protein
MRFYTLQSAGAACIVALTHLPALHTTSIIIIMIIIIITRSIYMQFHTL